MSVRTSIVPPGPRPPPADTPDTSPVVTTSQVTALFHDFAVSLGDPCRVRLFGWGLEELPGAGCVADDGAGVQAEGGCQVQGIGAGG